MIKLSVEMFKSFKAFYIYNLFVLFSSSSLDLSHSSPPEKRAAKDEEAEKLEQHSSTIIDESSWVSD